MRHYQQALKLILARAQHLGEAYSCKVISLKPRSSWRRLNENVKVPARNTMICSEQWQSTIELRGASQFLRVRRDRDRHEGSPIHSNSRCIGYQE